MKTDIKIIHALDNEVRLKILRLLSKREMHVYNISEQIKKNQPIVSIQLSKLSQLGVVNVKKKGNKRFYYLINKKIKRIIEILDNKKRSIHRLNKFHGGKK